VDLLCHSEVYDHWSILRVDYDIRWLEISMYNAESVNVRKRRTNTLNNSQYIDQLSAGGLRVIVRVDPRGPQCLTKLLKILSPHEAHRVPRESIRASLLKDFDYPSMADL
jgi:hypothetical protein